MADAVDVDVSNAEQKEQDQMEREDGGIQDPGLEGSLQGSTAPGENGSTADEKTVAVAGEDEKLLQQMRTSIAELDPLSKDVDDATLRRFLRARSRKVDKAVKMFVSHQRWRRSFVPLGYIPEEQVKNELEAKKVYVQGYDKTGKSIGVIMAAKHDAYKRNLDEFKSYIVFNFDKIIASARPGEEKFTVILDLQSLKYRNLDPRGWISIFDFLQAHFPERLGRLFIVHVPYIFHGAWKLVTPFIDKATKAKIMFVDNQALETTLLKEIDRDQLPDIYGGTLALVPIQDTPTPNWPCENAESTATPADA